MPKPGRVRVADVWGLSRVHALPVRVRVAGGLFSLLVLRGLLADPDPKRRLVSLLACAALLTLLQLAPSRIRVGPDGVLTRWLGIERFYAVSEIARVERYEQTLLGRRYSGLRLELSRHRFVTLPISPASWAEGGSPALFERLAEAIDAHRRRQQVPEMSALLRGKRATGAWLAALRSIGSGANVDMRTAPLHREQLFDLAQDSRVQPLARLAAAIAVAPRLSACERTRLRSVARASASPELRSGMERANDVHVSDGDLTRALEKLEASRSHGLSLQ